AFAEYCRAVTNGRPRVLREIDASDRAVDVFAHRTDDARRASITRFWGPLLTQQKPQHRLEPCLIFARTLTAFAFHCDERGHGFAKASCLRIVRGNHVTKTEAAQNLCCNLARLSEDEA